MSSNSKSKLILPNDYLVLDTETDGLLGDNNSAAKVSVTEWGSTEVANRVMGNVVSELCEHKEPLPLKIIELTHITDAMLIGKPPAEDVFLKHIWPLFEKYEWLVGHNVLGYDYYLINKYCLINGKAPPSVNRYIDSASIFKVLRQGHRNIEIQWPLLKDFYAWHTSGIMDYSYQKDKILYSLDKAIRYLGVDVFNVPLTRHRAGHDCVLTHRVIEKIREYL